MSRKPNLWRCVLLLVFTIIFAGPSAHLQDQPQEGQSQSQQKDQQQQQQKKKKGGFFGGLKAVTGESGEQTEATRSAGSKSVGEGQTIGNVRPTATDRQKVTDMEKYSVPDKDLKKFQQDGQLAPKQ